MADLVIDAELITSNGALSVYYAALDELNRRYGTSDEDKHVSLDELLPPRGLFLVARVDRHLVGGVGLRPISDPTLDLAEIKRLWVRPDCRRLGYGIALMNEIEARARELKYRRLYLESGYAQPEALELYRGSGWESVEQYPSGVFSYPVANRFTKPL
ncbi:MAG: Acetyltransferase [Acidimicrobiaceae bacterium]|nr:Acetyltransferase [Acidimicrobiaceae bacterium]